MLLDAIDRQRSFRLACWLICACIWHACSETPTGPSSERYQQPRISSSCAPAGTTVKCTLTLYDEIKYGDRRDATSEAEWIVVPPEAGRFTAPGVLTPLVRGEAEIHARLGSYPDAGAPRGFLIGPGQDARALSVFGTTVQEADARTAIVGATVQIVDGYRAGASCTTLGVGWCYFEQMMTEEAFRVQVTKSGYRPTTVTCMLDAPGVPTSPAESRCTLILLNRE